jgi:putative Ca2+/H+ antiporter (TMEM165/GDT1 family)
MLLEKFAIVACCSLVGVAVGMVLVRKISKPAIIYFVAITITIVGIIATVQPFILYFINKY